MLSTAFHSGREFSPQLGVLQRTVTYAPTFLNVIPLPFSSPDEPLNTLLSFSLGTSPHLACPISSQSTQSATTALAHKCTCVNTLSSRP